MNENSNKKSPASIIRIIIIVIASCVFCYSSYKLISIFLEYKKGNDIYNNIQEQVLNTTSNTITINDSDGNSTEVEMPFTYNHEALLSINPEGIGYLYLPAFDSRLPLVQSTDNDFYLTHTFDKTYNGNGCVFEDYQITDGLDASHVILYGHNMKNGSMFGQLPKYDDYSFWNTNGNDVFYIYTKNKIIEYKIFSAYISEPISDTYTYNFSNLDGLRNYAASMKANSLYDTGVDISNTSQVVTLSTCTRDGSNRFIIHGTYIGENILTDSTN